MIWGVPLFQETSSVGDFYVPVQTGSLLWQGLMQGWRGEISLFKASPFSPSVRTKLRGTYGSFTRTSRLLVFHPPSPHHLWRWRFPKKSGYPQIVILISRWGFSLTNKPTNQPAIGVAPWRAENSWDGDRQRSRPCVGSCATVHLPPLREPRAWGWGRD